MVEEEEGEEVGEEGEEEELKAELEEEEEEEADAAIVMFKVADRLDVVTYRVDIGVAVCGHRRWHDQDGEYTGVIGNGEANAVNDMVKISSTTAEGS